MAAERYLSHIFLGLAALALGACVSGGPAGGDAPNGDYAERHCLKYGKHAEPTGIADSGRIAFKCVSLAAGGR